MSTSWTRRVAAALTGLAAVAGSPRHALALGDASTHFQVFVPPNASTISRYVVLVVTSVSTSPTLVDIIDDGADGDTDDSAMGITLQRGESYVVALKDGAVNDDQSGKADGDYFIVNANHPVVVQMATSSSWQHDWAASESKTSLGTSFFLYNPQSTSSPNDIDVFAYSDNTAVTVTDVTVSPRIGTGLAPVKLAGVSPLLTTTLATGQDTKSLGLGIDILLPGHTYWVQATRPVTVQYGALDSLVGASQARDGGGFVPSDNGSSTGSLFYFGIPHDPLRTAEKELRIACFDDGSRVTLSGWIGSAWTDIASSVVASHGHLDFVGATNAAFAKPELYRLTVDPGHRCTVFEGNWLETGDFGTSDVGSYVASSSGSNLGTDFIAYVGPCGDQRAVSGIGGSYSHVYVTVPDTASSPATVTVRDADTLGTTYTQTARIAPGLYNDFRISTAEYTALRSSGHRPYVTISSDVSVNAFVTNFNDNWNDFVYSTLESGPAVAMAPDSSVAVCGRSMNVSLTCDNSLSSTLFGTVATLDLPPGVSYRTVQGGAPQPSLFAAPDGASTLTWDLGDLAAGSTQNLALSLAFSCSATNGCGSTGLVNLAFECAGKSGSPSGRPYAGHVSSPVTLEADSIDLVEGIRTSYVGSSAQIAFDVGAEDGAAQYQLTRSSSPTAAAVPVAMIPSKGPSSSTTTYSVADTGALPGETYFYRVVTAAGGCTATNGPVVLSQALAGSSAYNGGLESNGRLSAALARRAIARSIAGAPSSSQVSSFTVANQVVQTSSSALAALAPATGPLGTSPVEVSPTDLLSVTNASDVFGANYVDANNVVQASLIVIQTVGQLYEHSKALCDRANGASLLGVDLREFATGEFTGMVLSNERKGTVDHAMEFRLYENTLGSYDMHAGWLNETYPVPTAGQTVLSVQAWSRLSGGDTFLVQSMLDSLNISSGSHSTAPDTYFRSGGTLGGHVLATAVLPAEGSSTAIGKILITTVLENGQTSQSTLPSSALAPAGSGQATLDLHLDPFTEATLELDDANGVAIDRAWMHDGAWTAYDDAIGGGATQLMSFASTGCQPSASGPVSDLTLAGCGSVAANVASFAGVARTIDGAFAPLDLSAYASMSFWLQSDVPANVCIWHAASTSPPACAQVAARPNGAYVSLPLSLLGSAPACEANPVTDANFVAFSVTEPGPQHLTVARLSFSIGALDRAAGDGCVALAAAFDAGADAVAEAGLGPDAQTNVGSADGAVQVGDSAAVDAGVLDASSDAHHSSDSAQVPPAHGDSTPQGDSGGCAMSPRAGGSGSAFAASLLIALLGVRRAKPGARSQSRAA